MRRRFLDAGQQGYDGTLFLVRCPRCGRRATVTPRETANADIWSPRRFACHACGHTRDWPPPPRGAVSLRDGEWGVRARRQLRTIYPSGPHDWYFRLPLWLQTSCCGRTLWAYDARHVAYLEEYVGADLREHRPEIRRSLAMRLPTWMKAAKHRGEVLRGLAHLRALLLDEGDPTTRSVQARPDRPPRYTRE